MAPSRGQERNGNGYRWIRRRAIAFGNDGWFVAGGHAPWRADPDSGDRRDVPPDWLAERDRGPARDHDDLVRAVPPDQSVRAAGEAAGLVRHHGPAVHRDRRYPDPSLASHAGGHWPGIRRHLDGAR